MDHLPLDAPPPPPPGPPRQDYPYRHTLVSAILSSAARTRRRGACSTVCAPITTWNCFLLSYLSLPPSPFPNYLPSFPPTPLPSPSLPSLLRIHIHTRKHIISHSALARFPFEHYRDTSTTRHNPLKRGFPPRTRPRWCGFRVGIKNTVWKLKRSRGVIPPVHGCTTSYRRRPPSEYIHNFSRRRHPPPSCTIASTMPLNSDARCAYSHLITSRRSRPRSTPIGPLTFDC